MFLCVSFERVQSGVWTNQATTASLLSRALLSPPPGAPLPSAGRSAAGVLPQLPGVGVAVPAVLAHVQLDARVDLHVGLELVGLSEPAAAHGALVRLLSAVHQQVALVVLGRPELFAARLALVRLDSGVEQLVLPQLRGVDETFVAVLAGVWPLPAVPAHVVEVEVAQVEGLPAGVAVEVFIRAVALLVGAQGAAGAEGPDAGLTAERFGPGAPASALGA